MAHHPFLVGCHVRLLVSGMTGTTLDAGVEIDPRCEVFAESLLPHSWAPRESEY